MTLAPLPDDFLRPYQMKGVNQIKEHFARGDQVYGVIYKATNIADGKVYIGQTTQPVNNRITDHKAKAFKRGSISHFHSAIRKYGFDSFEWEVIDLGDNKKHLDELECLWIGRYGSMMPSKGYNLRDGGGTGRHNEESRKRISLAGKGRKESPEQREKKRKRMTGSGNTFFGKKHDKETLVKCGIKNIGRKLTPEHIAKCVHLGESNHRSKIDGDIARQIKVLFTQGIPRPEIQKQLGLGKDIVYPITVGKSWGHIEI